MLETIKKTSPEKLPRHVAIIMDGNRRWAKKKGLPFVFGHRKGVEAVKKTVEFSKKSGFIKQLTLYAFSTENWKRSKLEVRALMFLLKKTINEYREDLKENGIALKMSGRISELPEPLRKEIASATDYLKDGRNLLLNIAVNYGGRQEILDAANALIKEGMERIEEKDLTERLYTWPLPDPDLIIRTSGEMRLSNFLVWQSAYSELYVTDTLWPDFDEKEMIKAVLDYAKRDRRIGA